MTADWFAGSFYAAAIIVLGMLGGALMVAISDGGRRS